MRKITVAVVGAAGAVGSQIVRSLHERRFPIHELRLFATEHSAGNRVAYGDDELVINGTSDQAFTGVDVAFFAATAAASRRYAPVAVAAGAVVIDKTSAFRMDPEVPLIVPEVNPEALSGHKGIVASPNCSTIQLVVALKPIADAVSLKRVVVSTYQAVSGSGREAIEELTRQTAELGAQQPTQSCVYPQQICQNVLPAIDGFDAAGHSAEEWKIVNETRRILSLPDLPVVATAVRVPVITGHSESVYIETERPLSAQTVCRLLARAPGVIVFDDPRAGIYPTPLSVAGHDEVYIGRIRDCPGSPNAISLWVVADNLRKGAATNAIQIAELMHATGLLAGRAG